MYAIDVLSCGMVFSPSFMKISTGLEANLRFCLSNLSGCNFSITDGKELRSALLK
jgi:hypothetical protein